MEYAIGITLALVISCLARLTGLDRDRAFYAAVAMAVASYYVLFAAIGGSTETLIVESVVMATFVFVAVIGFKRNLWLVVACLGAHGVFDALHDLVSTNPGVPESWPAFCLTFDVSAAAFLAWLLLSSSLVATPLRFPRGVANTVHK